MIPNYTIIDAFIATNKNRDDIVGDLCKDAMDDKNFPVGDYYAQVQYLKYIEILYPHIKDAVDEFFAELERFKFN